MATHPTPTAFLSYSHLDKNVARRLVRRLSAYGISVWFDERELRVPARLTPSIRYQIEEAEVLLVIASLPSTRSTWVGKELDFAAKHGTEIIPLFIEPVNKHRRFRDHLGIDVTCRQTFADLIDGLVRDLFVSCGLECPAVNPVILTAGLRDLADEEPDLAPLILGCLDSEGLHQDNMETVYTAGFHALDEALNALLELMPISRIAYHAAYGFYKAGAGVRALSSWISATGDGGLPLVTAVGTTLAPMLIPTAIQLLTNCNPPNNHATYQFIHHNATQLNDVQRRSVIRLVTWPIRTDTSRLGDVLGWVALQQFPNSIEIQRMWTRWVHDGAFDGEPSSPKTLANYLADAHKNRQSGWEAVDKALTSHVRSCLRSGDRVRVFAATCHISAAADAGAPVLAALLREAEGVSGTSEWHDWEARDPDVSELMKWYVFEVAREATHDRDWLSAWNRAKHMVEYERVRQLILKGDTGRA